MRKGKNLNIWLAMSMFLLMMVPAVAAGGTIYVDADAPGPVHDGSSWATAYKYLQDALTDANSIGEPVEIRVADGIYTPDSNSAVPDGTGDRTATFELINGVTIKGGYAGFGEPDPNARDIDAYETILTGDLNGNDEPNFVNNDENSYHVVTGSGTDETGVLDGFTITAGNANGQGYPLYQNCGGGMYNYGYPDPNPNSPTLNNCTFRDNFAIGSGGGISNRWESSPRLTNCIFIGNSANQGGGMSNSYRSNSTLINCIFIGNSATSDSSGGGGIFVYDTGQTLINCLFLGNSAPYGGGMDFSDNHEINLINCVFSGNSANYGGGMHSWYFCQGVNLYNCSFSKNSANYVGGAICCDEEYGSIQKMDLINCILWGNNDSSSLGEFSQIYPSVYDLSVSYCDIQGGWWPFEEDLEYANYWGMGNIDADPLFVEPGYWDANGVWVDGDYHLLPGSPCINAGDPNYVAEPNETDLDGNPRIIGSRIDMGAYEYSPSIPAEVRIVPRTINLASEGKWITCYISLGENYNVADIEPNTVFLQREIQAQSLSLYEQAQVATARFSRSEVQEILNVGDAELTITGRLTNAFAFEGTDVIRVINKAGRKSGTIF